MCKKKIAISCENGIGCQYLSQRVKGLDVYIFLWFSCYFFIQLYSLRLYFLTKPPEALPEMSQLMNSTDTILGVSSYTAELSLMERLGFFCFGFIFKKCHNISHAMKQQYLAKRFSPPFFEITFFLYLKAIYNCRFLL